jgi:hypothetical protein
MDPLSAEQGQALRELIERQRTSCLWYLKQDWFPKTLEEVSKVLDAVQCHGDRAAFIEAGRIRQWLSPNSSSGSAAS